MQTHTDRRSPSQVKVGHREGVEQYQVQVLTRLFHAHLSLFSLFCLQAASKGTREPTLSKVITEALAYA